MTFSSGTRLGPYEVLAPLGAGGMGEVYRARDTSLERSVALKVLPEEFFEDRDRVARFEREAKALAALNHPGIAAVHSFEATSGRHILVMELVEGEGLDVRIARGAIPPDEALPIARQIAEALEAAHEKGIVHRDLKPANVMVGSDGRVKLLDFGLAKALEAEAASASSPQLTRSPTLTGRATAAGVILGTAAYMSPEQARGKPVDKRADIWAFGVVFWEMLTGRRLFHGETVSDTLAAVITREPDWTALPPAATGRIQDLLRRCLAKEPRRRLQAIGDARIVLEEIETGTAEPKWMATSPPGQWPVVKWRRLVPWGAAAFLAAAAAVASVLYYQAISKPEPVMRFSLIPETAGRFLSHASALALSPDGARLAYTYGSDTSRRLYLRSLDQPEATPLAGTEGAVTPFFSPDGRWIGFFADGKLKKISVSGGAPIAICDASDDRGADWGPDDTILFTPTPNSPLERVSASGGVPREVTRLGSPPESHSRSHRFPQFLPGGRQALFDIVYPAGNPLDHADIAAVSLETGEYKVLLHGGSYPRYVSPGYIIYAHGADLLAVPFDRSRLSVTGPPATVVKGVATFYGSGTAYFAISQTGILTYLPASANAGPKGKLVWVSRQGKVQPISQTIQQYFSPRLLPGDRRLIVDVEGEVPGIWSYDIARDTLTPFAIEGRNRFAVVSQDGKAVAYVSIRNGSEGIFVRELEGRAAERRLTTTTYMQKPDSFSPDGKLLAFTEGSATRTVLKLLPLEGAPEPVSLLPGAGNRTAAAISPDGRWIAYVSDESGRDEVYVEAFPGGGQRTQISSDGGAAPVWSHGGGELFYRNGGQLLVAGVKSEPSLSAGKPEDLFAAEVLNDFDVSEDGKRFLMVQTIGPNSPSGAPRLDVVLNWFEDLRRIARGSAR